MENFPSIGHRLKNRTTSVHVETRANGSLPRTMHGEEKEEEKEEEEEEEDTRKCIRFESYSQHGIGFSFAPRCWKVEGGTNWRGWLAGWPFASGCTLRAAHT